MLADLGGAAETVAGAQFRPRQAMARPAAKVPPGKAALGLGERELVSLIAAVATRQDRAAFAALFRHFVPRLKAYGLRAGSAANIAEEIAQEAMLAVWRRAATFDPAKASVTTWIFTILRNKRIDLIRREHRPEIEPDDPNLESAAAETPEQAVDAAETEQAMRLKLAALPPEQSALIRKAFFEDKSHSAIAAELSLPLGTVKSRIRTALAQLRVMVSEQAP